VHPTLSGKLDERRLMLPDRIGMECRPGCRPPWRIVKHQGSSDSVALHPPALPTRSSSRAKPCLLSLNSLPLGGPSSSLKTPREKRVTPFAAYPAGTLLCAQHSKRKYRPERCIVCPDGPNPLPKAAAPQRLERVTAVMVWGRW